MGYNEIKIINNIVKLSSQNFCNEYTILHLSLNNISEIITPWPKLWYSNLWNNL